jgi:type I restriction enzyme S subunit
MTLYRFDQIASNLTVRVEPADTDLERYVGLEHLDPESLKLRRWGSPADVIGQKLRFWKGDIIYGKRRAYQRKLAVADFDGICSAHAMVLRAKQDVILPELLPFFLQSEIFHQRAMEISVGSLSPTINWSALAKQEFPLPPVDEQRRIADLLWAADDVIVRNQEVVEKLLTIQKWLLDNWLIDKRLNSEWQEIKLEEVCDIQNGQVDPKQSPYCDMIHIASDDIESGTGRILEMNTAAQDKVISGNYLFTEKAIVYSKIRPNLRKVIFPKFSGVCSADIYPIYPRENILPELLFQLFLSETFTQYAISQSARSAFPKINRTGLLAFKFRLPPIKLQEKIAEDLIAVFQSLEVAKQHVENSRILKYKLLEKVLNA